MSDKRLRVRLIGIYSVTTALIMASVFAVAMLMTAREAQREQQEKFVALLTSVADKLQTEPAIQHSWLRQYERDNALLLRIIDNGKQLVYNSEDDSFTATLFEEARALSLAKGIDILSVPLYSQRRTSPVARFSLGGKAYYGAASVMPVENGYRALLVVQSAPSWYQALRVAAFFTCYALSVIALSFVGAKLIDRALRPAIESRERQTEFIAAASHELRSPLAVIRANAATVAQIPEEALGAAAVIENECSRMSRLIGDMLLLASTDMKSWPVKMEPLDVDTLLLSAYETYTPVCAKWGYRLELTLPDAPLPHIKADAGRLSQVLGILVDNALDYCEAEGNKTIAIQASLHKGELFVDVIDHGVGIPDEQKPRVFERFHRGDRSRRAREHFGLGLAIASELIALHGGSITLLDTDGGGCTFRIKLTSK